MELKPSTPFECGVVAAAHYLFSRRDEPTLAFEILFEHGIEEFDPNSFDELDQEVIHAWHESRRVVFVHDTQMRSPGIV